MAIPYFKLSGAGNDFLALVEPGEEPAAEQIRAWCRRGLSLGADGVFVLSRAGTGARMAYYNADGNRSELCLNGARCAARLALHLGWGQSEVVRLVTDAGKMTACAAGEAGIELQLPAMVGKPRRKVLSAGVRHEAWRVKVGVPHVVMPWEGPMAHAPVGELGRPMRSHPDLGPEGANINFVRFLSQSRCEVRTFERGVEAETLACGTGVVAAVAAGVAMGRLETPATALTAGGFELTVGGDGKSSSSLTGDARILSSGELLPDAGVTPAPPEWS